MSKKHHFVPRSMLSGFSIDGKRDRVWVYDKAERRAYASSIKDAGAENHFNTVVVDGMRVNFEGAFQRADDLLASLTSKIVSAESLACLSSEERKQVAYLASLQLLRVGLQRSTLLSLAHSLKRLLGSDVDEALSKQLESFDENTARVVAQARLADADKHAHAFLEKDWVLNRAPAAHPFWTSDNPVVMMNQFPYGEVGLLAKGVQIAWPLSARLTLEFMCSSIPSQRSITTDAAALLRSGPTLECTRENVTFYNSHQVCQSMRFVYGPMDDFSLADEVLRDNPSVASRPSMLVVGEPGTAAQKDRMPLGQWLVVYGHATHSMLAIESWVDAEGGLDVLLNAAESDACEAMLSDSPFSMVEIYCDRMPCRSMREISIVPIDGHPARLRIRHADESLRELFSRLAGQP